MDAREHRKDHDVERTEKMIPFITSEIALRQHVCIFELDSEVQIGPVKQPLRCNSVGSGHVSHRRNLTLVSMGF